MMRRTRVTRSAFVCLLVLITASGLTAACGQSVTAPTAPSVEAFQHEEATAPAGLTLTADLTSGSSPYPKYRLIPTSAFQGSQTIPNFLGSVQSIDGKYYTLSSGHALMKYRGLYYLVPRSARFSGQYYANFCGSGWGAGHESWQPVIDGGLDAACRAHDLAWSRNTRTSIVSGDIEFKRALDRIQPKWAYERDYTTVARAWMNCRVASAATVPVTAPLVRLTDNLCKAQIPVVASLATLSLLVR